MRSLLLVSALTLLAVPHGRIDQFIFKVPAQSVLTSADFTNYLGAFAVPSTLSAAWENIVPYYGDGFALKYESGDSNTLHFFSLGYGTPPSGPCPDCDAYTLYQMRVPGSLSTPGTPTDLTAYTVASTTGSKIYSGTIWESKRLIYYLDAPVHQSAHNNGDYGLYYDATGDWLYQAYGFGYTSDCRDWSLMRSRLNYGATTGETEGPWGMTSIAQKSVMSYLFELPTGFVSSYTPGKRLAIGAGSPYSIQAACDASLGPALTAFTPPADGATEQVDLANTPLVGYWPYAGAPGAGHDRADRGVAYIQASRFTTDPSWPATKWMMNDYTYGGAYVETATRRGFVFLATQGQGQCNYNSSYTPCEHWRPYIVLYDYEDMAAVASGSANRYDVQPSSTFELSVPFLNLSGTPYSAGTVVNVTSITATGGSKVDGTSGALPVVTTATAHGRTVGQYASIRGTSVAAEYDAIWYVETVPTSTTMTIKNTSDPTGTFAGTTATGGTLRGATTHDENSTGIRAISFDPVTDRLYVVFAVFNSGVARLMVGVYQIP